MFDPARLLALRTPAGVLAPRTPAGVTYVTPAMLPSTPGFLPPTPAGVPPAPAASPSSEEDSQVSPSELFEVDTATTACPDLGATAWYKLEMQVNGDLEVYAPGQPEYSATHGPAGSFRMRLKVYPLGVGPHNAGSLGAFLELIPPSHLAESEWSCPDVRFDIAALHSGYHGQWWMRETTSHTFTSAKPCVGWENFVRDWSGWLSNKGELMLEASARLPTRRNFHEAPSYSYPAMDFTQDPAFITFFVHDGPSIFFDKRVLIARSDYFRDMLSEARFKEAQTNEIDLRSDPHADVRSVTAILTFFMSETFLARGDAPLAFAVRRLADRYGLKELLLKAESELESLLCADNVLEFLGQVTGTGGLLEMACLEMIKANSCELLDQQQENLDRIAEANPELVKQLFRLLIEAKSHKKRRLE